MRIAPKILRIITQAVLLVVPVFIFSLVTPISAFAANGNTEVAGKLYEFDEKSKYEYSETESYTSTSTTDTYGKFTINASIINNTQKDGIPVYEVDDGTLDLVYSYNDTLLDVDIDSWHLYDDGTNSIDGEKLDSNVQKGAILVYTSIDRINWTKVSCITNAFGTTPASTGSIYTAKDVELINGCYYKVVIAYGTRIRIKDSNFLFIDTDKFDYKKYAEVYEFYAYTDSGEKEIADYSQTYNIGSKIRVKELDGYYGEEVIEKNDPHYGWELGNFFVSGYTDKRVNDDGSVVFLKNLGDKITLWFSLKQDINKLNGDDALSITEDTEGYDKYFETPKINFGKGTLIVRYTDYNNNKSEPQIYTNYLEANTSIGADTKVQLFEEGDYEVALDYEVTRDGLIDTKGHYRISFKYSVRNGNCMVYPYELETNRELTNSSMTENGFRLDLAKSRYLQVNIKREIMKDSADGLVEDTRFNGPAKDGAEYTDDGIYTITVSNLYTNQFTVKKIYVGSNNIMRAYMTTGLSIPEINNLVANGAEINEDGTIKLADKTLIPAQTEESIGNTNDAASSKDDVKTIANVKTPINEKSGLQLFIISAAAVVIVAIVVVIVTVVKKKSKHKSINDSEEGDTK